MIQQEWSISSLHKRIISFFDGVELQSEDAIVVAFSGGPDSTFLLQALVSIFGNHRIIAAHLNHSLRGKESDGDAVFCEQFASAIKVSFFSETISAPQYAEKWKIGIEEACRRLRYTFLERIRAENNARCIATGHTMDDQAETVLFRFTKGTRIRGLKGIPAVSGNIIRPMLTILKSEILSELQKNGIDFRMDSSNSDVSYDRNRIRIAIIPELAKLNPSIPQTMADFAAYSVELDTFLEGAVSSFLWEKDAFVTADFIKLDSFLQKEILARIFARSNGTGVGLSSGMVEEMRRFSLESTGGKEKTFWKLLLQRSKGRVIFRNIDENP